MSFAFNQDDDQPESQIDENQQGGTGLGQVKKSDESQTDSAISLGGGGSGTVSMGGSNVGGNGSSPQGQAQKPSSSGSWTNLQSYLDANADQGADVGSKIAGNISDQGQKAQTDINSAASDFSNSVNQNTVNSDPDQINSAISNALGAKSGYTANPDEVGGFQKQLNASYGGPKDFTAAPTYASLADQTGKVNTAVGQTKSEAGRDVLLGNTFQNASQNGYNQGEKNLDQMLLENNPTNQKTFSDLQNRWSGLGDLLSGTTTAQNAAAQKASATDSATAAAAKAALDAANNNFQTGLQGQATKAQQSYQGALDKIKADLAKGQLTPDEMNALGVSAGEQYYNLNPNDYLTPGMAPTLANTATADQYAEAAALAQLAGQSSSAFLPMGNASQAGAASGSPYSFDTSRFNSDIGGAKAGAQRSYDEKWNAKQAIPSIGASYISMADMQSVVDQAAQIKATTKNLTPDQVALLSIADKYKPLIDDFKLKNKYSGGVFNQGTLLQKDPSVLM